MTREASETIARLRADEGPRAARAALVDPALAALSAMDRVHLFAALVTSRLHGAVRDARELVLVARDEASVVARAPAKNPFVIGESSLAAPWEGPQRLCITPAALPLAELLRYFVHDRRLDGAENECMMHELEGLLEGALGPRARWDVVAVRAPPFDDAYCCGYDVVVVGGPRGALLLAIGMVCG